MLSAGQRVPQFSEKPYCALKTGGTVTKSFAYVPNINNGFVKCTGLYLCRYGIIFMLCWEHSSSVVSGSVCALTVDEDGSFVLMAVSGGLGEAGANDSFCLCSASSLTAAVNTNPTAQPYYTALSQLAAVYADNRITKLTHAYFSYETQAASADYTALYAVCIEGVGYISNGVWYIEDEKISHGGEGGTNDYNELENKPKINGVTLAGSKTAAELGLASAEALAEKADRASTLAGYGITDAKIEDGTITLGGESLTPLTQHQDLSGITDALAAVIDGGAKNLIPFDLDAIKAGNSSSGYTWNDNVCTISDGASLNITVTVYADGTITAAGSKPATQSGLNFRIVPAANAFDVPLGDYVLSGCPDGGSSGTYQIRALINNSSVFAQDTGNGAVFTATADTIERIEIAFGTGAMTNFSLTFRPMICARVLYDVSDRYVPYAPSNRALYDMLRAQQHA